MANIEIERRFKVNLPLLYKTAYTNSKHIIQGYLIFDKFNVVRVRVITNEDKAFLTIKCKSDTLSVPEYEYEIPYADGLELISKCVYTLTKTRYEVINDGDLWEVDVMTGECGGLVIAEIELENEDQPFSIPEWVTEEITGNKSHSNLQLAMNPKRD